MARPTSSTRASRKEAHADQLQRGVRVEYAAPHVFRRHGSTGELPRICGFSSQPTLVELEDDVSSFTILLATLNFAR